MRVFEKYPQGVMIMNRSCLLCPRKEPLILTQQSVEGDGQIALCVPCVGKLAKMVGWISPDRADTLIREYEQATTQNADLQGELRGAKEQLASLSTFLARYATPDADDAVECPDCHSLVPKPSYGGHRRHCKARART